jgi:hypothetical protein
MNVVKGSRMIEKPKFQVGLADILLATALIASIIAAASTDEPVIAFLTASVMGAFIWHRPILSRLWATGMVGLGAGLFAAGCTGDRVSSLPTIALIGWGTGIVVGTLVYVAVFHWLPIPNR